MDRGAGECSTRGEHGVVTQAAWQMRHLPRPRSMARSKTDAWCSPTTGAVDPKEILVAEDALQNVFCVVRGRNQSVHQPTPQPWWWVHCNGEMDAVAVLVLGASSASFLYEGVLHVFTCTG